MLASRGLSVLKHLKLITPNTVRHNTISIRNSHNCNYRSPGPAPRKEIIRYAEIVQGFAWWWVLWHLYTEPGHILGEFEYPEPSNWTDEELGIPS